jgi:hypothetical protein
MDAQRRENEDTTATQPPEKLSGTSESRIPGLSTLPKKRPRRRFLGLFAGKR